MSFLAPGYQAFVVRFALLVECLVNDGNGEDVGDGDAAKFAEQASQLHGRTHASERSCIQIQTTGAY
jgi:hypothetical protein